MFLYSTAALSGGIEYSTMPQMVGGGVDNEACGGELEGEGGGPAKQFTSGCGWGSRRRPASGAVPGRRTPSVASLSNLLLRDSSLIGVPDPFTCPSKKVRRHSRRAQETFPKEHQLSSSPDV